MLYCIFQKRTGTERGFNKYNSETSLFKTQNIQILGKKSEK